MKKVGMFFIKSLIVASVCFPVASCDGPSQEIPVYEMLPVSRYERDNSTTLMFHDGGRITGYEVYRDGALQYSSGVMYKTGGIYCTLNGVDYLIQFDNTIGGSRVKELSAYIGSSLYYKVIYFYDAEGRLSSTEINVANEGGNIYYTRYEYGESSIKIIEDDVYEIQLGDEENTGHVFNVLDHANAPRTSAYVFNPELYFLNIYGKPAGKLPEDIAVTRSAGTMRAGRHYYEYR
ncbi:MAG: hypothetical protein LBJ47_09355 [Tannerella sp.]|jgi:hypothetical protein|nr:hypothetical protein [Tannerella sp.]